MINKRFLLFISILSILTIYSCEKSVIEYKDKGVVTVTIENSTDTTGGGPKIDSTKFSTAVLPILTSSCVSCHGASFNPSYTEANAYKSIIAMSLVNVAAPKTSILYVKLTDPASSHSGRATSAQSATILKWITQGAKNN